jgi:hypothetical protein
MSEAGATTNPPPVNRWGAASIFFFAFCLFSLTNCGFDTSDALDHYKIAKNFVETGDLGFPEPLEGLFTTAPNGWTYASHEFGNIALMIPVAALNHLLGEILADRIPRDRVMRVQQFLVSLLPVTYTALTVMFLFLILLEEFRLTPRQGFAACLLFAACTFTWTYARNLFDGVLCALILTAALRYLFRFRREQRTGDALIAFALFGFAVDTRVSMVLPTIAALGYVSLYCPGARIRALICAAAALAPFAVWQLWYNHLRTGNPLLSPVQSGQYEANELNQDLVYGLAGFLVSPGKSVFVYAPLLFLSVAFFPRFWQQNRPAASFILVVTLAWFLLHAKIPASFGWGWGPRYFVTLLPMMLLPALVNVPALWQRTYGKLAILVPAALGFLLALASLIGNWHHRMELRHRAHTLDESFIWSLTECQSADMLAGAYHNIRVVLGLIEPTNLANASDLNNYASNGINMWWYTLPRAGVPPVAIFIVAGLLLLGLVVTACALMRTRTETET